MQTMTVGELINVLKEYDPSLPVVLANYEFGFDVLKNLQLVEAVPTDEGQAPLVKPEYDGGGPGIKVLCLGPVEPGVTA